MATVCVFMGPQLKPGHRTVIHRPSDLRKTLVGTIWPLWFGCPRPLGWQPTSSLRKVASVVKGHKATESGYGARIGRIGANQGLPRSASRHSGGASQSVFPLRTSRAELAFFSSDQYRWETTADLAAGPLIRRDRAAFLWLKTNFI